MTGMLQLFGTLPLYTQSLVVSQNLPPILKAKPQMVSLLEEPLGNTLRSRSEGLDHPLNRPIRLLWEEAVLASALKQPGRLSEYLGSANDSERFSAARMTVSLARCQGLSHLPPPLLSLKKVGSPTNDNPPVWLK